MGDKYDVGTTQQADKGKRLDEVRANRREDFYKNPTDPMTIIGIPRDQLGEIDREIVEKYSEDLCRNYAEGLREGTAGWDGDMNRKNRDWGFEFSDINCEVIVWTASGDGFTPPAYAERIAGQFSPGQGRLYMVPGEEVGHLGGMDIKPGVYAWLSRQDNLTRFPSSPPPGPPGTPILTTLDQWTELADSRDTGSRSGLAAHQTGTVARREGEDDPVFLRIRGQVFGPEADPAARAAWLRELMEMNHRGEETVRQWLAELGVDPADIAEELDTPVPHPHAYNLIENWAHNVRRFLVVDPEQMDELIGAQGGTWRAVESGESDLTIGQVRTLLRRIPGARELYSSLSDRFFPDLETSPHMVGSSLQAIRERAGLQQEQVAVRLGVQPATIGRREAMPQLLSSREEWDAHLRALASLLPSRHAWKARISASSSLVRVDEGVPLGACLATFRFDAELSLQHIAEKTNMAPATINRIETGVLEPSQEMVEAYLLALTPRVPRYPEGYRNIGEYLEYLRQESGATLEQAAAVAGMTSAMMRGHELGSVIPSTATVGAYLDAYSDGSVSVAECVESFPDLQIATSRPTTESNSESSDRPTGAATEDERHTEDLRPASKTPSSPPVSSAVVPDIGSAAEHHVRLHTTARVSDTDDLVRAVVADADKLRLAHRLVGRILHRYDDVVEVTPDGDRSRVRAFAFREFERAPDRTVVGGRRPSVTEAVIQLSRPTPDGDWTAEVVEVSSRRDPALRKLARLPEASPNADVAQQKIRRVAPTVAGTFRPLGLGVTEISVVTEVSVDGRISGDSLIVGFDDGSSARFAVRVNPVSPRLAVTSMDGRLTESVPIWAPRAAAPHTVEVAVTRALGVALGRVVSRDRGYPEISPSDPRYIRDTEGKLVATKAARLDAMELLQAEQLLAMKTLPGWQRRHLFELRREVLDRLQIATGPSHAWRERRDALYEMEPVLEHVMRWHGSRLKRRKPLILDSRGPGLAVQTSLAFVASASNLPAAVLTDDEGQQVRYYGGAVTGSWGKAVNRFFVDRKLAQESADTAPPYLVYRDRSGEYLFAHISGAVVDVGVRVGADIVLSGVGAPTNPALLTEIAIRRLVGGVGNGISAALTQPEFNAPVDLASQALAVARRGEAVDEFVKLQKRSLLLHRGLLELLDAETVAFADEELADVAELLRVYQTASRMVGDLNDRLGLDPAALRTKAAPLRAPSTSRLLVTQVSPAAIATAVAGGAAALAGQGNLAALGLRPVSDRVFEALLRAHNEREKARERIGRARGNNAYLTKRADDATLEARSRLGELLDVEPNLPDPLPAAKRKLASPLPGLKSGAATSILSSPFSAVGYLVPGLEPLAFGLLLSGVASPISNQLYIHAQNIYEHFGSVKSEKIDEKIALKKSPTSLAEFESEVKKLLADTLELGRRILEAFDETGLPVMRGDVSPVSVFRELHKVREEKLAILRELLNRIESELNALESNSTFVPPALNLLAAELNALESNSIIVLERFKLIAAERNTPELFDSFIASITPGLEKTEPEVRARKVADAFLHWHESDVKAIAKLEMVDRYIAEHVSPELQLTALFPDSDQRTPLNFEYVEFARTVVGLPFVSATPDAKQIEDVTGRFAAVAVLAAARNGVYEPDPAKTGMLRLEVGAMGKLLSAAAKLIERDIERLAHDSNLEDLLTDTRPPGNATVMDRGNRVVKRQLLIARQLLRTALGEPRFREQYIDRISQWLAETQKPIVEDAKGARETAGHWAMMPWRRHGGPRWEVPPSITSDSAHDVRAPQPSSETAQSDSGRVHTTLPRAVAPAEQYPAPPPHREVADAVTTGPDAARQLSSVRPDTGGVPEPESVPVVGDGRTGGESSAGASAARVESSPPSGDLPELAAARGFGTSSATDLRRPLRIGTWNVAGLQTIRSHGMWDYNPRDIEYFAEVLKSVHPMPDVLLFQEGQVGRVFYEGQPGLAKSDLRDLAKALGYPYIHETVISRSHMSGDNDLSMAIMSMLPFEQTWARRIPDPDLILTLSGKPVKPLPRYMQGAKISGITVVNAFPIPLGVLGHSYEAGGGMRHAAEVAQTLKLMIEGPAAIGGDINTPALMWCTKSTSTTWA